MKNAVMKSVVMFALLTTLAVGCIKNDVPYEIIIGDITEMEIRGAESISIDSENLVIDLVLSDTVDLRSIFLKDFNVTPDARIMNNITGEVMDTLDSYYLDLTQGSSVYVIPDVEKNPYTFTVITYQDYVWKLKARQNIERAFTLAGEIQIGEAIFSGTGHSVIARVPDGTPLTNIKIKELKLGPSNATIAWIAPDGSVVEDVNYKAVEFDFETDQQFVVKFFDVTQNWTVKVEYSAKNITNFSADSWAKYARFSAQGQTDAGTPGFEIRKVGEGDDAWVAATGVMIEGGLFSGTANELMQETDYEARALIDKGQGNVDYSDIIAFRSEAVVELPNLDFEGWKTIDIGATKGVEFPNAPGQPEFWSTGNEGSMYALFGQGLKKNVTMPVTGTLTRTGLGIAVQMKTYFVNIIGVKSLATGTIFSGKFGPMNGAPMNPNAQRALVHYGQPYVGRPKALKGWYRYIPQIINTDIENKFPELMNGSTEDNCKIYISLEVWGEGVTKRPANPLVVGYGELKSGATDPSVTTNNGYVEFEFDIDYTSAQKPDNIVMCATCCALSDDFCGAGESPGKKGSELYIDDFELVWE